MALPMIMKLPTKKAFKIIKIHRLWGVWLLVNRSSDAKTTRCVSYIKVILKGFNCRWKWNRRRWTWTSWRFRGDLIQITNVNVTTWDQRTNHPHVERVLMKRIAQLTSLVLQTTTLQYTFLQQVFRNGVTTISFTAWWLTKNVLVGAVKS